VISDAALVIAAGGSGLRYGRGNKLFAELAGMPVAAHSIRNLGPLFPPECRIMAVPEIELPHFAEMLEKFAPEVPFRLVAGGATRSASVLAAARETGGAVPGRAVIDTLKRSDGQACVAGTVSRENLFAVETPQCFDLAKLRDAYRRCPEARTDDAGVMEAAGYAVRIVPDPGFNVKLTCPEDLELLELLTKAGRGRIL